MMTVRTICKVSLLCTALLLPALQSTAQTEHLFTYDYRYQTALQRPLKYELPDKAKAINFVQVDHKGKAIKHQKRFDEKGNLLTYHKENKAGEMLLVMECTYDPDGKLSEAKHYNEGKLYNTRKFERNANGKPTLEIALNKKGQEYYKNVWTYDAKELLVEAKLYKKGGEKLDKKWTYEYIDGQKSRTVLTKGNGKVINIWTFGCDQKGEKLEKQESTTQVCRWSEDEGQFLVKVYQTFDEKGKVQKHVRKYTMNDTLPVETAGYNADDVLRYKNTFDRSYDRQLTSDNYFKGKLRHGVRYAYDGDRMISSERYFKGRLRSQEEYSYNGDILTEHKRHNYHKNRLTTTSIEVVY